MKILSEEREIGSPKRFLSNRDPALGKRTTLTARRLALMALPAP